MMMPILVLRTGSQRPSTKPSCGSSTATLTLQVRRLTAPGKNRAHVELEQLLHVELEQLLQAAAAVGPRTQQQLHQQQQLPQQQPQMVVAMAPLPPACCLKRHLAWR